MRSATCATGATLAWRLVWLDAKAITHDFDLHLTEVRVTVRGGLEARLRASLDISVAPPAELALERSSFGHRAPVAALSLAGGQSTFIVYLPAQTVIAKLYSYRWHEDHFMAAEAELTPALGRVNAFELQLPDK